MGGGEGNVEEKGRVDCGLRGDEVLGLATEGVEYVDVFEVFSRRPTSVERRSSLSPLSHRQPTGDCG